MSPLTTYPLNIEELLRACILEDRSAQKRLFEIYAPKMMSLCRRYTRDRYEAEDVMQDGFVKVFKNLSQYSKEGSFEGWMKRIMINIALKKKTKKSYTNEISGIEEYNHISIMPDIFSAMSADELLVLISKLPEGYRNVFSLYVVEGYSHKEIGKLLKIGESTSRSQLVKARKMLQEQILNQQRQAV